MLFSIVHFASAETETIGPFQGINNSENSFIISPGQAQDLLNVDATDQGKSIKKRKGYGTAFTLNDATSPLHGIYNAYDTDGSDFSLFFNGRDIERSVSGQTPVLIYSTATNGATWQCTDSNGFAYCANTGRNGIFKIDASAISMLTGFTSTGTMVTVTPERLAQSGFSTDPNIILFSASNDFTNWTLGGNPTSPIQFTITSPGSGVKHITYAHGRVYWFKDASFGYILEGGTQADWKVVTISAFLGNINNTSIYRDEILYFQGNDGHFYAYDGSNLVKLSKDIQATIDQTQGRTTNSWTQSSQAEFQQGNSTTNISLDLSAGNISLSNLQVMASSRPITGTTNYLDSIPGKTAPYYLSRSFTLQKSVIISSIQVIIADRLPEDGKDYDVTAKILSDSGNLPGSTLGSCIILGTSIGNTPDRFYSCALSSISLSASTTYWITLQTTATVVGGGPSWWGRETEDPNDFRLSSVAPVLSTGIYSYQLNGSTYVSSGKYYSQVNNAPNLTSWDQFQANSVLNSSQTVTYYIRARSGIFTTLASTPAWAAISPGSIPTVSTGAYFQIRVDMTNSDPLSSPLVSDFSQNWFEGGASDKSYAIYHDNANWWSVASGTGATTNNKILKFNLLNPGWYIYDIGMDGMYVRNQSLYFGSVSSGKVFKFGDAENDNGSAITAYWKSKDFFGTSPFLEKNYTRLSSVHSSVANSTATVTYTLDGSSATAYSVSLGNPRASFIQKNVNLPQGRNGKTINFKIGNSAVDQPFEIFGAQIEYTNKPWVPSQ